MANHNSAQAFPTEPSTTSIERSLALILPEESASADMHRKCLAAAPLALWLLDALDPERVLTVGAAGELLHLSLCQTADDERRKAAFIHVSQDFTDAFTSARVRHGTLRSQLSAADARHPRLGAEGQFDLILLHLEETPTAGVVGEWRAGLSQQGVLALHLMAGDAPDGVDAVWTIGDETLALFWGPGTPEDIRALMPSNAGGETLGAVLATSVAALALGAKRRAETRSAAEVDALRERHRADLILLTRQLADLEDKVIEQRVELKAAQAALAAARQAAQKADQAET